MNIVDRARAGWTMITDGDVAIREFMTEQTALFCSPSSRELVITRVFDAPRAMVFKAFTDPKLAIRWWGPKHHPATQLEMDARPGGVWRICLTGRDDGRELWQHGRFLEVVAPERIVFSFVWEEEGERGLENVVTITFAAQGKKTLMTFRHAPFHSLMERDGHTEGWSSCFDRLDENLQSFQGESR